MTTLTIRDISQQLAQRAEDVCRHLLPNGQKQKNEYQVGGTSGEKGSSLQVHLTGAKAGVWADFATGQGGDLVDLWREVRRLSMHEAVQEAKEFLGIREPEFHERTERTFKAAAKPAYTGASSVAAYLTQDRKLDLATIKAFGVESKQAVNFHRDNMTSDAYYLPYIRDEKLIHWKLIGIQRNTKGKKLITVSPGTQPCLYGWQAVPETARSITLYEGELDAMSGYQYGHIGLSVPFGGGVGLKQQWIEHEFPYLERFEEIYLCLDQDQEGKIAAEEISKRLGAERCKMVVLPKKDMNECLMAGISKQQIDAAFQAAKPLDPLELKTASDFKAKVISRFYPDGGTIPGYKLPWGKTYEQVRLRSGELSIWSGTNGHGKSQMLGHCMLEVIQAGGKVCIASMEILPDILLHRMIRQASAMRQPSEAYIEACLDWLSDDRLWIFGVTGTAGWKRILEVFQYAHKRHGIDVFVIDSMMKCGIEDDDYSTQKLFMDALCDFKTEYQVSVHLVIHPKKGHDETKPIGKSDVRGTAILTSLADNVFGVYRNKPKEEALQHLSRVPDRDEKQQKEFEKWSSQLDAILGIEKQRNGEFEGKFALWYDQESYQYLNNKDSKPKRYVHYSGEPVYSLFNPFPGQGNGSSFEMLLTDEEEIPA